MPNIKNTPLANVPEFLRVSPTTASYLGAVGEFLDGTRDYIENFKYSHDYEKSSDYSLNGALGEIGFVIPPNVDKKISRVVLRDAIHSFILKGTTDSLLWVLRIIGVTPIIRNAWIPSPDRVRKGYIKDIVTGVESRYDLSKFTYTDLLYGNADITENGTFFRGTTYNDVFGEEELSNIPIFGEHYKTEDIADATTYVEKVPYLIVRITDQAFNVVTEPYQDESGNTYQYGITEEYEAVAALIEYFLFNTSRPSNVRVMIVASLQSLSETITVSDVYEDNHIAAENAFPEILSTTSQIDSIVPIDVSLVVGDPIIIGNQSMYHDQFSFVNIPTIQNTFSGELKWAEDFGGFVADSMVYGQSGDGKKYPVFVNTKMIFTTPEGITAQVYGLIEFEDPYIEGVLIPITPNGNTYIHTFGIEYHAFYIKLLTPTTDKYSVRLEYNGKGTA